MKKMVKPLIQGLGKRLWRKKSPAYKKHPMERVVNQNIAHYFEAAQVRTGLPTEKLSVCFSYIFDNPRAMLVAEGIKAQQLDNREITSLFVNPALVLLTNLEATVKEKLKAFLIGLAKSMKVATYELVVVMSMQNGRPVVKTNVLFHKPMEIPLSKFISHFL